MYVVRTFKIYCLSNFQVCNTVLLTVVTTWYIRLLELAHFVSGNWYSLTNIFHTPYSLTTAILLFLCVQFFFFFKIPCINEIMQYLFLSDLFHLQECPQSPSCCCQRQDFFLSHGSMVFHWIYIPIGFIPLSARWAFRLFSNLNDYE